ncbi:mCG53117, isoform CRA_c [Mus musculus]|nr:mCG53117, isoform CRA_c [Mus musculus]
MKSLETSPLQTYLPDSTNEYMEIPLEDLHEFNISSCLMFHSTGYGRKELEPIQLFLAFCSLRYPRILISDACHHLNQQVSLLLSAKPIAPRSCFAERETKRSRPQLLDETSEAQEPNEPLSQLVKDTPLNAATVFQLSDIKL